MPRILPITSAAIETAADRLRGGGVVAFPTETVYGLGGHTFSLAALEAIYQLKGRPADNPLIAHVLDAPAARRLVTGWNDRCDRLARRFWPGPLTLVLPKAPDVPDRATAGRPTIAVRAPAHPGARLLLEAFGRPISAPSANRSGAVSPTCAGHVSADFAGVDDLIILDGGPCSIGIESTVLDLSIDVPRILRPGSVTAVELREELGEVVDAPVVRQIHSPGTSEAHYSPQTPAELVEGARLAVWLSELKSPAAVVCFDPVRVSAPHRAIALSRDPQVYAASLYDALRRADAMKLSRIVIERPPPGEAGSLWSSIHDRLRRATTPG